MQKDIVQKPLRTQQFSGDCLDLIKGLLQKEPAARIGARHGIKEIKEHPFFGDLDWNDIYNKKYKYEKQFLKIDLMHTNFNTEHMDHGEGCLIGIDVSKESNETEEAAEADPNDVDLYGPLYCADSRPRARSLRFFKH